MLLSCRLDEPRHPLNPFLPLRLTFSSSAVLAEARIKSENVGQTEVVDSLQTKTLLAGVFNATTLSASCEPSAQAPSLTSRRSRSLVDHFLLRQHRRAGRWLLVRAPSSFSASSQPLTSPPPPAASSVFSFSFSSSSLVPL